MAKNPFPLFPSEADLEAAFERAREVTQPAIAFVFVATASIAAARGAWKQARKAWKR